MAKSNNNPNPPRSLQALMACGLVRNMMRDVFNAHKRETTRERIARERAEERAEFHARSRAARVRILESRKVA